MASALCVWARSSPRTWRFFTRTIWNLWRARRRRAAMQRGFDGHIPTVLAISPTMSCNYDCSGCYSRGRSTEDELTTEELDSFYAEAEELGFAAVVVTGGEPLVRSDTIDIAARHRRLLFVMITNGSLLDGDAARRIARAGNILTLVSIEGFEPDTDLRRNHGAHAAALEALSRLRAVGACFGFALTNTASNTECAGSDEFIDQMAELGCTMGYFTEYVPCGPDARPEWLLSRDARDSFRRRVLEIRRSKPLVLIQFPQDEYGSGSRCSAAGRESFHISSQGAVEPCPFAPTSRESVREGGLRAACRSPFLRSIRDRPELLARREYACALFEHRDELLHLAERLAEK